MCVASRINGNIPAEHQFVLLVSGVFVSLPFRSNHNDCGNVLEQRGSLLAHAVHLLVNTAPFLLPTPVLFWLT